MGNYPQIILKKGKEVSIKRRHHWIFSGAVAHSPADLDEGQLVKVMDSRNQVLGMGFFAGGSIMIRMICFDDREIDRSFWLEKISAALRARKLVFGSLTGTTNAYRLVHGEGDELPGLVIDHYAGNLVIQGHHPGIFREREKIVDALKTLYGGDLVSIYDKSASTLHQEASPGQGWVHGSKSRIRIRENDVFFEIDLEKGQKTGFFLDQRDNRKLLQHYCKGKKILNTFCYSGGFSVYALKAGADLVSSVDISAEAVAQCKNNLEINGFDPVTNPCVVADVMKYLRETDTDADIIILDPPAFAKSMRSRHNAVQAYKRLNALAIKKIKRGGIVFTFSCSQVVDRELFAHTVTAAGLESGRQIKILHQLSQGADHPVNLFHQETAYLKGLILYVE
ncbi:23S rRNA (cytosine1962-C5)-methyltransferase [Cyclobacterium lianum]|uniref:23S rRNA (Cytosine1962-C5)-methyltransferase n=1 Tax=Cyclobacterium lianum TaxID=388280 RepID=A0A1M7L7Q6_9BACT|nr:class I SAM-dependent rRNA methyltransferase [Cyclobacterium lianum]SHM74074.1 23S rRNA (cytosine1962-C5)-methyltransferase [Cyclobacterium lianum]